MQLVRFINYDGRHIAAILVQETDEGSVLLVVDNGVSTIHAPVKRQETRQEVGVWYETEQYAHKKPSPRPVKGNKENGGNG